MKRTNGEGSIYRRKDGRWVGSIHVRTTTGKYERRYIYGKTRGDVEQKFADLRRKLDQGAQLPPAKLTVSAYLTEWVEQTAAKRVRPSTLTSYRHSINRYINPQLGDKKLDKLTARDVRQFLGKLESQEIGTRTIQICHATLRAALEDATREEVLSRNVARLVRAPRSQADERQPLSVEEARTLLKSSRDHRLYALFEVLVLLGVRRSEALGLRWQDVDFGVGSIAIRNSLHRTSEGLVLLPPKTKRSRRSIPLPEMVISTLKKHQRRQLVEAAESKDWHSTGFVFTTPLGTPIDPRNCTRIFQKQCADVGVPVVPLHAMRHTCVSLLLSMDVPPRVVMEIAGHSALDVTMNVYGHVNLESRRDALDKLAGLFDEVPTGDQGDGTLPRA